MKKQKSRPGNISSSLSSSNDLHIPQPVKKGKQRFTTTVNGDEREYYVHIPSGYNGTKALPVVIMLHGSGGNGEKFYNISGWVQEGEKQNIITVFPSSWKYSCVIDDGIHKTNAEKWATYELVLCGNSLQKDDVKFLGIVIEELKNRCRIDTSRIYLVGFSNGGQMAGRCAIELSDKLAGVICCAGSLSTDRTLIPKRKLPVMVQIGASDEKLQANLGITTPLPLNIPQLLSTYPAIQAVINANISSFALDKQYTLIGNVRQFVAAEYKGISGMRENVFRFVVIKDLRHQYPNGTNHPLNGASIHWQWLRQFRLKLNPVVKV